MNFFDMFNKKKNQKVQKYGHGSNQYKGGSQTFLQSSVFFCAEIQGKEVAASHAETENDRGQKGHEHFRLCSTQ